MSGPKVAPPSPESCVDGLKVRGKVAARYRNVFEDLACRIGLSTNGVVIVILRGRAPHTVANKIVLPHMAGDWMNATFVHELQHARDFLDGIDMGYEEQERRARLAEVRLIATEAGR